MQNRDHNTDPQSVLAEKMGVTASSVDRENVVGEGDFSDDLARQDDVLRWNPELYSMEFLSDKAMHWCSRNDPDWREEVVE